MKKRIMILFSVMMLLLSSGVTALAFGGFDIPTEPLFEGAAYVQDPYGYMTQDEVQRLENMAAGLSETYQCGMYIAVVEDMFAYTGYTTFDAFEAATEIYKDCDLGIGAEKNGTLLILSMSERDYALIAYGSFAHAAFTDYGKDCLSDIFLADFADDYWYDGFAGYLEKCEQMLQMAAEGNYFDVDTDPDMKAAGIFLAFVVSAVGAVIALIVCAIISSTMRSVGMQRNASTYIREDSLRLDRKVDLYTHTTQSRQKIERQSHSSGSRGGTTIRSGGFSGKSGKF